MGKLLPVLGSKAELGLYWSISPGSDGFTLAACLSFSKIRNQTSLDFKKKIKHYNYNAAITLRKTNSWMIWIHEKFILGEFSIQWLILFALMEWLLMVAAKRSKWGADLSTTKLNICCNVILA